MSISPCKCITSCMIALVSTAPMITYAPPLDAMQHTIDPANMIRALDMRLKLIQSQLRHK